MNSYCASGFDYVCGSYTSPHSSSSDLLKIVAKFFLHLVCLPPILCCRTSAHEVSSLKILCFLRFQATLLLRNLSSLMGLGKVIILEFGWLLAVLGVREILFPVPQHNSAVLGLLRDLCLCTPLICLFLGEPCLSS